MSAGLFVNDTATTEIYALSLHDALPISKGIAGRLAGAVSGLIHLGLAFTAAKLAFGGGSGGDSSDSAESGAAAALSLRSERHTSELQSRQYLVCRLLLEKNTPADLSSPA